MIQHNLLPQPYAQNVRYLKLGRFVMFFFSSLAVLLITILVLFLPSYFSLSYEQEGIATEIAAAKESVSSKRVTEAEKSIKALNRDLAAIASYRQTSLVAYMHKIAEDTPPGIVLTSLSFDKKGARISIQGTAKRRDDLLDFVARLRAEPSFTSINSPITNLLKEVNAAFEITIELPIASSKTGAAL